MHNVFTNMDSEEGDSASIIAFKTAVRDSIMRRWSLDGIEPSSPLVLASALDPRFREELSQLKDANCGNPNFKSVAIKEKESSTPPTKKKKTALDILLGLGGDNDSDASESDAELEEFLLEKSVPCNSDVMAWWSMNERRFPKLAKLAKIYLGIPATSASSERLFSKAGIITAKHRNCLKAKNVEAIVFLNKNSKFLNL